MALVRFFCTSGDLINGQEKKKIPEKSKSIHGDDLIPSIKQFLVCLDKTCG